MNKLDVIQKRLNVYGYLIIDTDYKDVNQKINIIDQSGYKYFCALKHIFTGHSPTNIGDGNPYSLENMRLWLRINNLDIELISTEFCNTTNKLEFKCNLCESIFERSWNNIKNGCTCRKCRYIKQGINNMKPRHKNQILSLSHPYLCEEWDSNKNKLLPKNYSEGSGFKVWWVCRKCNHEWEASIVHRTRNHSGCPHCSKSKGENKIEEFLVQNGIKYIPQFRFPQCKRKQTLPFDFFLPENNTCIEYQGEQHYKPFDFASIYKPSDCDHKRTLQQFKYIKENDNIKKEFCKNNGIRLLEIPFNKIGSLSKILSELIAS